MTRGIIRWSPMRELDRFFDDDFMTGFDFEPAIDMFQEGDNVIVKMALPDIEAENVGISVENDVLTVTGRTEDKREVKREDYYRKEIRQGSFSRSIVLPMKVKGDKTEAQYAKGVLTVTLPKAEEAKPKKIAVKIQGK